MMNETNELKSFMGQAVTVLIVNRDEEKFAVFSKVQARVHRQLNSGLIIFKGAIKFEERVTDHIREVVYPLVDSIFKALHLPRKTFEISIMPQKSEPIDRDEFKICGFYIDVPVLLAVLSAGLQMMIPKNLISAGCVLSSRADVLIESQILEEIKTALEENTDCTLIHPAADNKDCINVISKDNEKKPKSAHGRNIQTITFHDLSSLIEKAFSEEQILLASLRQGFYKPTVLDSDTMESREKAAAFLSNNNVQRFWSVYERKISSNMGIEARALLLEFIRFHIDRKIYPKDFGEGLQRILQSLEINAGIRQIQRPLISLSECIQLIRFTNDSELKDVETLLRTIFEEKYREYFQFLPDCELNGGTRKAQNREILQSLLYALDQNTMARRISFPIDSARASYVMDSITINRYEDFNDAIVSYYVHLLLHTEGTLAPIDPITNAAEALSLLERTFTTKGGFKAALAEARDGINGGLRLVLDMMTDQLKREEQEKHVNCLLKSAMDPMDWDTKVALMDELMLRLKQVLPPKIASQPPERFAGQYEIIVKAYVDSINEMNLVFRKL